MNVYYDSLKRLYQAGKLSAEGVFRAVARGWITEDECREIITLPRAGDETN